MAAKFPRVPRLRPGDAVPDANLHKGFPPTMVSVKEFCKGKKVVIVGLPGAFTPTWSSKQIPGYLAKQAELRAKGVTDVVCFCVNDGAVMQAWGEDLGVGGSMVTLLGDPLMEFTKAMSMVLKDKGPMGVLGNPRCKRFSMLVDNGIIKSINVAASKGDPAGDSKPDCSLVERMLEILDKADDLKEGRPPKVKVGDQIPDLELHKGFPPEMVKTGDFCKGKRVVLVGLPGAFTPTWSNKHVPGYLAKESELKAKGVSDVIVMSVNDGAVMKNWSKSMGVPDDSIVQLLGDPGSKLTRKLGVVFNEPGVLEKLGNPRSKRFSMLIDDGVIKTINMAVSSPEPAFAEQMLADL